MRDVNVVRIEPHEDGWWEITDYHSSGFVKFKGLLIISVHRDGSIMYQSIPNDLRSQEATGERG